MINPLVILGMLFRDEDWKMRKIERQKKIIELLETKVALLEEHNALLKARSGFDKIEEILKDDDV